MNKKISARQIERGLHYAREIDEPVFFVRVDKEYHIWEVRHKINEGKYRVLYTGGSLRDCKIWLEINHERHGLTYLYGNQHLTNKKPVYDGDHEA